MVAYIARECGYSLEYIGGLDYGEVINLYRSLEKLQARDRIFLLNANDYSHSKAEKRKKFFKDIQNVAYPIEDRKAISATQMLKELNQGRL
jgi:hypothetical protein